MEVVRNKILLCTKAHLKSLKVMDFAHKYGMADKNTLKMKILQEEKELTLEGGTM